MGKRYCLDSPCPAKTTDKIRCSLVCYLFPFTPSGFLSLYFCCKVYAPRVYKMIKVSQSCMAPNNKWSLIALKKCFDFKAASIDFSEKNNSSKITSAAEKFCFTKTFQILTKAIVKNNKQIIGLNLENYLMITDKLPKD